MARDNFTYISVLLQNNADCYIIVISCQLQAINVYMALMGKSVTKLWSIPVKVISTEKNITSCVFKTKLWIYTL